MVLSAYSYLELVRRPAGSSLTIDSLWFCVVSLRSFVCSVRLLPSPTETADLARSEVHASVSQLPGHNLVYLEHVEYSLLGGIRIKTCWR